MTIESVILRFFFRLKCISSHYSKMDSSSNIGAYVKKERRKRMINQVTLVGRLTKDPGAPRFA